MAVRQLVVFKIGEEEFGLDIGLVNIIERPLEIFKIPNTPDYIEGLVNLRGKVHSVFNLRRRFNMPAREFDENTKIIMASADSSIVGFIVDEVKEIIKVEENQIENAPKALADLKRKFLKGIVKTGERVILLLDADGITNVNDLEKMAN